MQQRHFRTKNIYPDPVKIESLSHDGRGITHVEGKTVFVEGALPGELVKISALKQTRQYDDAIMDEILEPSGERVEPKCAAFGVCGGCSLQHLQHEKQISYKQQSLLDNFNKMARVLPDNVLPPIKSPAWGYRYKARLGVKYVKAKKKVYIGFREKHSRYLANMTECEVLDARIGKKLEVISEAIGKLSCYNKIAQIEVAFSETGCALVFRNLVALTDDDKAILTQLAKDNDYHLYLQPKGPKTVTLLYPEFSELSYSLADYKLKLVHLATDFTQVNPFINPLMIKQALALLELNKSDNILELYSGIGNFTLPIARAVNSVVAVEGEKSLVERANDNAKRNAITNVEYHIANLMEDTQGLPWLRDKQYNKILLDPPRSGAKEMIDTIAKLNPERIVYVSCNPATLARDTDVLVNTYQYKLTKAGVIDMFPHTAHVESIALFTR